ncbi:MAG TPA: amino acid ABC transporter permease [Clostridiales bacterium]|nr:amino acid ABC transporter permease [Clostridiales bacterium]
MGIPLDLLIPNMLSASSTTLKIFFYTIILSIPLGFVVALLRGSRFKIISVPIQIYQLIFRGTPLMLQLFFFMYGPFYIFGFSFKRSVACILAFVINYAAYFGEIFRGGIGAIPKGQYEAAKVLGYTKFQTFMRIILPQVVKHVIPATGNELMTLVKDTSSYNQVYSLIVIRFFKPLEHNISVNKPTVMEDSFVSSTEIAVNGYTK